MQVARAGEFWARCGHLQGTGPQGGWLGGRAEAAEMQAGHTEPSPAPDLGPAQRAHRFQHAPLLPAPGPLPRHGVPNTLTFPGLQGPAQVRRASSSSSPRVPFQREPQVTHSGVQKPLVPAGEGGLPLGASGQPWQELVPLRGQNSRWHQSHGSQRTALTAPQRTQPVGTGTPPQAQLTCRWAMGTKSDWVTLRLGRSPWGRGRQRASARESAVPWP